MRTVHINTEYSLVYMAETYLGAHGALRVFLWLHEAGMLSSAKINNPSKI